MALTWKTSRAQYANTVRTHKHPLDLICFLQVSSYNYMMTFKWSFIACGDKLFINILYAPRLTLRWREISLVNIRLVNYCRFVVKSNNLQYICAVWYFSLHAENITLHFWHCVITLDLLANLMQTVDSVFWIWFFLLYVGIFRALPSCRSAA